MEPPCPIGSHRGRKNSFFLAWHDRAPHTPLLGRFDSTRLTQNFLEIFGLLAGGWHQRGGGSAQWVPLPTLVTPALVAASGSMDWRAVPATVPTSGKEAPLNVPETFAHEELTMVRM
ncbi:MAG: hypothetical protein JWR69_4796, partial [Pedosphaera sp.]|nr:hypothetical protein [Pedosphaera sp.]